MRSISRLTTVGFGRHRIHHAMRTAARMRRHLEHVDDGVVDMEIDEVLDAPAHGGAQLVGRDVGRFDEQQTVAGGIQHADGRCAPVRRGGRRRARTGRASPLSRRRSGRDAACRRRRRHLRRGDAVGRREHADLAADSPPRVKYANNSLPTFCNLADHEAHEDRGATRGRTPPALNLIPSSAPPVRRRSQIRRARARSAPGNCDARQPRSGIRATALLEPLAE